MAAGGLGNREEGFARLTHLGRKASRGLLGLLVLICAIFASAGDAIAAPPTVSVDSVEAAYTIIFASAIESAGS